MDKPTNVSLGPPISQSTHYGCPYCIGPIYFEYDDALKHMAEQHPNWSEPEW